jgi:hypothetical protein
MFVPSVQSVSSVLVTNGQDGTWVPQVGMEGDPLSPVTVKCGEADEIQCFDDIVFGNTSVPSSTKAQLKDNTYQFQCVIKRLCSVQSIHKPRLGHCRLPMHIAFSMAFVLRKSVPHLCNETACRT